MIGANNNPMNMFTGGGNDAFNRGMVIGNANSPFSSVADAFKATLDRYNQQMDIQTEQANKMAQIGATSSAALGNEKAVIDYKRQFAGTDPDANGPIVVHDDKSNKDFLKSTTVDSSTGFPKVSWSPVSLNAPENQEKVFDNVIFKKVNDRMNNQTPTSPIPGVPAAPVTQGTNGAVVDNTGVQTDKRAQAIQLLQDSKKVVNEDTIKKVMSRL